MEKEQMIRQELRTDPELMGIISRAEIRRREHRYATERASDSFLQEFVNRDREGAKIYCFFEEFRIRYGWNQKQCPKRLLFAELRKIMAEVTDHA